VEDDQDPVLDENAIDSLGCNSPRGTKTTVSCLDGQARQGYNRGPTHRITLMLTRYCTGHPTSAHWTNKQLFAVIALSVVKFYGHLNYFQRC